MSAITALEEASEDLKPEEVQANGNAEGTAPEAVAQAVTPEQGEQETTEETEATGDGKEAAVIDANGPIQSAATNANEQVAKAAQRVRDSKLLPPALRERSTSIWKSGRRSKCRRK